MIQRRRLLAVLAALVAAVVLWVTQGNEIADEVAGGDNSAQGAGSGQEQSTDPLSGLSWIAEGQLPSEAIVTLELIDDGGPYPYEQDDSVFENREGILPDRQRGYYQEYTVETPGLGHRGAKRIVTGDSTEFYWTTDHYSSFSRIRRSEP